MVKQEYEPSKSELEDELKTFKREKIVYVSPDEFHSAKQKGLRRALARLEVGTRGARTTIKRQAVPTTFALGKALAKGVYDFADAIPPEGMSRAKWNALRKKRDKKLKKKRK